MDGAGLLSRTSALPRFAVRPVAGTAAGLFVLDLILSGRYGFHRDELYFLDAGRHLQGGYVDQPALVPLLARVSLSLFGVWLPGLRLWSAVAVAATVIIAGLLARELGGGRGAQILAAAAVATMPPILGMGSYFGPTTLDIVFWPAFTLAVVRVGRTGDSRYWLAAGLILGLGLANKHSIGFFAAAVLAGVLVSGRARSLGNRWALAGAAVAVAGSVPDLWWQARNGWPTIAMTSTLSQENGGLANISTWVVGQMFIVALPLAWITIAGIGFLWRSDNPSCRALVWAYAILFVLFAVTAGAKVYYLMAAYIYLLAAIR
jgi:4-amino-4-deoxy-L-arabinose transferase-like glycosyltransferase